MARILHFATALIAATSLPAQIEQPARPKMSFVFVYKGCFHSSHTIELEDALVARLKQQSTKSFLWFRDGTSTYILDDPASIRSITTLQNEYETTILSNRPTLGKPLNTSKSKDMLKSADTTFESKVELIVQSALSKGLAIEIPTSLPTRD